MQLTKVFLTIALLIVAVQGNLLTQTLREGGALTARPTRDYTIGLADVLQLRRAAGSVLVDVRSAELYRRGHIAGAINIPLETIGSAEAAVIRRLGGATAVVVYCGGHECGAAASATRDLAARGVRDAAIYSGGFEQWTATGLPVAIGEEEP
jgi:rhodanese-related sulfurtransferase